METARRIGIWTRGEPFFMSCCFLSSSIYNPIKETAIERQGITLWLLAPGLQQFYSSVFSKVSKSFELSHQQHHLSNQRRKPSSHSIRSDGLESFRTSGYSAFRPEPAYGIVLSEQQQQQYFFFFFECQTRLIDTCFRFGNAGAVH